MSKCIKEITMKNSLKVKDMDDRISIRREDANEQVTTDDRRKLGDLISHG